MSFVRKVIFASFEQPLNAEVILLLEPTVFTVEGITNSVSALQPLIA